VAAVSKSTVPDVLAPNLDFVFCGINPGYHSDAKAAHFANPRNDFWRLLHAAGFTPRLFDPAEQSDVLRYGLGITNAAYRTTRGSSDARPTTPGAPSGSSGLPWSSAAGLGFVGKEAYRGPFGKAAARLQGARLGDTPLRPPVDLARERRGAVERLSVSRLARARR
jgi:TDG/mug DNA glycosylase family protein